MYCYRILAEVVNQIYRDDYAVCEGGSEPWEIIQELLELDHSAGELGWDLFSLLSKLSFDILGSSHPEDATRKTSAYCEICDMKLKTRTVSMQHHTISNNRSQGATPYTFV